MSKANAPQDIQAYVEQQSQLARLLQEANRREHQQQQLKQQLPPALRERVAISIDAGCLLLLTVANNATAQLLHFQGRKLLGACGCERLKIRVEPTSNPLEEAPSRARRPTQLSSQTAQLLRATADDINDEALSASLRRLAAHAAD